MSEDFWKVVDLAKKVIDNESSLNLYKKRVEKEKAILKKNKNELALAMNKKGIKTFESHELIVKVRARTFVDVDDLGVVPDSYKIPTGFRVNKKKIHREGRCPTGCTFRTRVNVKATKKD